MAVDSPIGYTSNYGFRKYTDGANPGAAGLNANFDEIDAAIKNRVPAITESAWNNAATQSALQASKIVLPEAYGAKGNRVTDDTAALISALAAAVGGGTLFLSGKYCVTEKITVDAGGKDVDISAPIGAEIVTSYTEPGSYWTPTGAIEIINAGNVSINGVIFTGAKDTGGTTYGGILYAKSSLTPSYMSTLFIKNCNNVSLKNTACAGGDYGGVMFWNIGKVALDNCSCQRNRYAGAMFVACKKTTIRGGDYLATGDTTTVNSYGGYGIMFAGQMGTGIDNENIHISGVRSMYNLRKGIDIHGGINVVIDGNTVKGFVYGGIYAVYEPGNTPNGTMLGDAKRVENVKIINNIVENDAAWFASLPFNLSQGTPYSHPIQTGNYQREHGIRAGDAGDVAIHDNTISNCDVSYNGVNYLNAAIWHFGGAGRSVSVKDNTIKSAVSTGGKNAIIIMGERNYYYNAGVKDLDDPFLDTNGNIVSQVENVEIANNRIFGQVTTDATILVCGGKTVNIKDNTLDGSTAICGIQAFNYYDGDIKNINVEKNILSGTYGVSGGVAIALPCDSATIKSNELSGSYIDTIVISAATTAKVLDNKLLGASSGYGVKMIDSVQETLSGNEFLGTFALGEISTNNTTKQAAHKNISTSTYAADGQKSLCLPNYDSHNTGVYKAHIETGSSGASANLMTVDASTYASGVALFDIEVLVTSANNRFRAKYKLSAFCGSDGSDTPLFGIDNSYECDFDSNGGINYTPASILPALAWLGTGNKRTLKITGPQDYTTYYATCKFAGWRLNPKFGDVQSGSGAIEARDSFKYYKGRMEITDSLKVHGQEVYFDILSGGTL